MIIVMKNAGRLALHLIIAVAATYALTGSLVMGGLIAVVEPICNIVALHFYEKAWDRVQRAQRLKPVCV